MVASRLAGAQYLQGMVNGAVERAEVNKPVEPSIMDKHMLYAMAWGIIPLPPRVDLPAYKERVRIKRACRAYAAAGGWSLTLNHQEGYYEEWALTTPIGSCAFQFFGTLQECCLRIVEHDIWPDGKPEDSYPDP